MAVFAIICFLLCPLVSLPIVFVCIKKDTKHRNVYLAILLLFSRIVILWRSVNCGKGGIIND